MPAGRRGWAVAALLWGVTTTLAVLFIDRSAALYAHRAFGSERAIFAALTHIVDPMLPLAAVGFLGLGVAFLLGWRPGRRAHVAFAICAATLLAVIMKDQLKYAFGRTWPETWVADNPSLVHDGVMAWVPFHGGLGWSSFPSGHATLASAPMTVLMLVSRSRWRFFALLPVVLVALGLYGADYHFPSDILAGMLLGSVVAAIAVEALAVRPPPVG